MGWDVTILMCYLINDRFYFTDFWNWRSFILLYLPASKSYISVGHCTRTIIALGNFKLNSRKIEFKLEIT
jgi:hypothetical protein